MFLKQPTKHAYTQSFTNTGPHNIIAYWDCFTVRSVQDLVDRRLLVPRAGHYELVVCRYITTEHRWWFFRLQSETQHYEEGICDLVSEWIVCWPYKTHGQVPDGHADPVSVTDSQYPVIPGFIVINYISHYYFKCESLNNTRRVERIWMKFSTNENFRLLL